MNQQNPLVNAQEIEGYINNGQYRKFFFHQFASEIIWGYYKKNKQNRDVEFLSRKISLMFTLKLITTFALAYFAYLAFEFSTLVGIGLSIATAYLCIRSFFAFVGKHIFAIFKAIKMNDQTTLKSFHTDDVAIVQTYVDKMKNSQYKE